MFTLFKIKSVPTQRKFAIPRMKNIQRAVSDNIKTSVNYYNRHRVFVPNENLLVSLIVNTTPSPQLERWRYVDAIMMQQSQLGNMFNIGSSVNAFTIKKDSVFLGKGTAEVLFFSNQTNYDTLNDQMWNTWTPVEIKYHPYSFFTHSLLNGKPVSDIKTGYCVITIDLPLLMLQYQNWVKWIRRVYPPDELPTVHNFIAQFVLPNMLSSFNDVAFLNIIRDYNELNDNVPVGVRKVPFTTLRTIPGLSETIRDLKYEFASRNYTFQEFLNGIQLPSGKTLFEFTRLLDNPNNSNSNKYNLAATLPYYNLLIQLDDYNDTPNTAVYNDLNLIVRRADSERWVPSMNRINESSFNSEYALLVEQLR